MSAFSLHYFRAFWSFKRASVGRFPFSGHAPTIYTIANTGAMLTVGQECSKERTALAAGPGCAADSNCVKR